MSNGKPFLGDYVLASKYEDGHLGDHWCVGWFAGYTDHEEPRYHVVDNDGEPFRGNGFRRMERITPFVGRELLRLANEEQWEIRRPTSSVWSMRTKISKRDKDKFAMVRALGDVWYSLETKQCGDIMKCLMKSSLRQQQEVYVSDDEIKSLIIPLSDVIDMHFDRFVKTCIEIAKEKAQPLPSQP